MGANISTTGTLLAALVCAYVLMQCYANNQAYTQYCDSASTASGFNAFNALAALAVLCLLLWNLRPR